MIFKGFKFGMLLQFAVGPMCLMVFNSSAKYGLWMGLSLVLAIILIDALYITLSGFGIAAIMKQERVKSVIKILGCIVLVLFGLNTIMEVFHFSLLPEVNLFSKVTSGNLFLQGLLLTASNPLTIIFWSGVFSTQVIEHNLSKKQLFFFGFGCVLSTLLFLSAIAFCGTVLSMFLSKLLIQILNIAVGLLLIVFGVKLLLKK